MKREAATFLQKAARSLEAAGLLLDAGHADFAASRAYYVMLYVADALLYEQGERFYDHAGSHAGFEEHFVRTGLMDARFHARLVQGMETRIIADYGVNAPFPREEAARMIDEAREFLAAGRALLAAAAAD